MIVRDFNEAKGTNRQVGTSQWNSVRLLLRGDGMGFSFHITTIYAGEEVHMHYKNHFEAVYCISGKGSIEDLATGEVHQISPGVMYALDKHDRHILRAESELILTCTFNPPLHGTEVHDETGAYPEQAEAI